MTDCEIYVPTPGCRPPGTTTTATTSVPPVIPLADTGSDYGGVMGIAGVVIICGLLAVGGARIRRRPN